MKSINIIMIYILVIVINYNKNKNIMKIIYKYIELINYYHLLIKEIFNLKIIWIFNFYNKLV